MGSNIRRILRYDTAVYWEPTGGRDEFGNVKIKRGIELSPGSEYNGVRWEEGGIEKVMEAGEERLVKATVYVGIDLKLGGYLYHGTLATLSDPAVLPPTGAYPIMGFRSIPDRKNREKLRYALL